MTPQHAPSWPMARHAALSARATALNTAQFSNGGRYLTRTASTIKVPSVFFQSENRLRFNHGTTPSVATGGGRFGTSSSATAAVLIVRGSVNGGCTGS